MSDDEQYFELANSWATDSFVKDNNSRRLAWIVATCAIFIAILQSIAIIILLPLKTVESFPILVDKTTGYAQRLSDDSFNTIKADEALTQSLLAQYVSARESFDLSTIKLDYRKTALWSSGAAEKKYLFDMKSNNPESPFNKYNKGDIITVKIKSVSQVSQGNALVRFDTQFISADGRNYLDGSWISVVKYQFSNAKMNYQDRLINPLGLQITSYRRDIERPKDTELEIINENIENNNISNVNKPVEEFDTLPIEVQGAE